MSIYRPLDVMTQIKDDIGVPTFEADGKIKFWHPMYRKMMRMHREGVPPATIKKELEEEFEEEIIEHVIKRLQ